MAKLMIKAVTIFYLGNHSLELCFYQGEHTVSPPMLVQNNLIPVHVHAWYI